MLAAIRSSIMAGIFISIGCLVNLSTETPIGPILFAFGLASVVHYRLSLFTGASGFCKDRAGLAMLPVILLGNIAGTEAVAIPASIAYPEAVAHAQAIVQARLGSSILHAVLASVLCGVVMTTAVTFARKDRPIQLLLGVPLFILAGFWHSIADAFYYFMAMPSSGKILYLYPITAVGNFAGCVLYNLLIKGSIFYVGEPENGKAQA